MIRIMLGTFFTVTFLAILAAATARASDVELLDSKPSVAAPKSPQEDEKADPAKAAAGKDLSTFDIIKNAGSVVVKEAGGAKAFVDKLTAGYTDIYNKGLEEAMNKRSARIARGETPTFWTDFLDGFTSTFGKSFLYTFNTIGWPIIKVVTGLSAPAA